MADDVPVSIDYTSKDYRAFRTSMLDRATELLPDWTSRNTNDFGVVLVELFAYVADILSFYGDRIANESYLSTATQRSSVFAIADMFGYQPSNGAAATVMLTFTHDPTVDVAIPSGTQVSSSFGSLQDSTVLIFSTTADYFYTGVVTADPAVPVSHDIPAVHGVWYQNVDIGVSTGQPRQRVYFPDNPVLASSVQIQVQDDPALYPVTWAYYPNLGAAKPGDKAFTVDIETDGSASLLFGDGQSGAVPPINAVITGTFLVGGGLAGNVTAGTLTFIRSIVPGVLSVTNAHDASGGADPESTDSIRSAVPAIFSTGDRAVTLTDFQRLAANVPGVAKASAQALTYTNVLVVIAPTGGGAPSETLRTTVKNYLKARTLVNVTVDIADPHYVPIGLVADVFVEDAYVKDRVQAACVSAIQALVAFETGTLGAKVRLAVFYNALNEVEGVDYAIIHSLTRPETWGPHDVFLAYNEMAVMGTVALTMQGGMDAPVDSSIPLSAPPTAVDGASIVVVTPVSNTFIIGWLMPTTGVVPDQYGVTVTFYVRSTTGSWNVVSAMEIGPVDPVTMVDLSNPLRVKYAGNIPVMGLPFLDVEKVSFQVTSYKSGIGPTVSTGTPPLYDYGGR